MKKLLIILCILGFAHGAQAQTTKGTVVATGSFGFSVANEHNNETDFEENTTSYLLSPRVGFIISDYLELGAFGTYSRSKTDTEAYKALNDMQFEEAEATDKAIGVYVKKYIPLTDKVALTGTGEIGYSRYKSAETEQDKADHIYYSLKRETASLEVAIRPGFSFFASEKISLNATYGAISYSIKTYENETLDELHWGPEPKLLEEKTNRIGLDLTLSSFSLGLSYFF